MEYFKTLKGPAQCRQLPNQPAPLQPNTCTELVPLLLTLLQAINTTSPTKLSEERSTLLHYQSQQLDTWLSQQTTDRLNWYSYLVYSHAYTPQPALTPRIGAHLIPFLFVSHNFRCWHLDLKDVHMYHSAHDQMKMPGEG